MNSPPSGRSCRALVQTPGVGDAEWVSYWLATLAMAAPAYRQSDPKFAGRLMWAWDRAGGPYAPESNLLMAPLVLIDPDLPRISQTLVSEAMPKAGYAVLRADFDRPSEKYLFFTCGRRREEHWARHKHRDLNSFSLLAYGVPLSLDPGTGPYRMPDQELWHRATVSHSTVLFGGREQQVEDGRILQFVSKPGADYLVADASAASPVLQFYRHILFVKPDYFIVWDFIRSYVPAEWMLHTPAREIVKTEHSFECRTPWEVDLDVHVLLPKEPIDTVEGGGRFGAWQNPDGRGAPPFTHQKYVRIRNTPNRDFLTVLHARGRKDPRLTTRLVGTTENVLEIKTGASTDYVLLFPVPRDFTDDALGIAMRGRVGVVRPGGLTLVDGERLCFQGKEVTA